MVGVVYTGAGAEVEVEADTTEALNGELDLGAASCVGGRRDWYTLPLVVSESGSPRDEYDLLSRRGESGAGMR